MAYDEDTLRWAISHTARLREYAEMARKRAAEFDARADRVEQTYGLVGNGHQNCEWCLGDPNLCDGSECQK